MKLRHWLLLLIIPAFLMQKDVPFYNGSSYFPVLMKRAELEKSVFFREAQTINNVGKLYYKDNFIFLNEKYKGIHIIDNSSPDNPKKIGFINAPGCVDIAIKKSSLYVDNSIDLVTIDLSGGVENLQVTERIKNVFPEPTPPDMDYIPSSFSINNRPEGTIIVGWERIENTNN